MDPAREWGEEVVLMEVGDAVAVDRAPEGFGVLF